MIDFLVHTVIGSSADGRGPGAADPSAAGRRAARGRTRRGTGAADPGAARGPGQRVRHRPDAARGAGWHVPVRTDRGASDGATAWTRGAPGASDGCRAQLSEPPRAISRLMDGPGGGRVRVDDTRGPLVPACREEPGVSRPPTHAARPRRRADPSITRRNAHPSSSGCAEAAQGAAANGTAASAIAGTDGRVGATFQTALYISATYGRVPACQGTPAVPPSPWATSVSWANVAAGRGATAW